jgi:AAA15 family ATPase/GTPase
MCDAWLRRERIEQAIETVNNKIESLQGVAKELNQRLNNEQLQVQDH